MKRLLLLCFLAALPAQAWAQPKQVVTNCGTQTLAVGDGNNGYITTNGLECVSGSTSGGASGITATSKSGTVTLGGSAQVLMAANTARVGCALQPQTGDVWINTTGGTAGAIQPAQYIPAPSLYTCPAGFKGAISLFGATTGTTFYAEEDTVP